MDEDTMVDVGEQAATAAAFVEGLLSAMGVPADVEHRVVDDDVAVDVTGDDLGVLVGPRGVTLQSIEELTRAAVQHAASGASARVHVDVAGYRAQRREALAGFTRSLAEEVRASGAERTLEPMNAADRKVVHDTVAELEGVVTASVGEEPRRRVVIRPA